MLGTTPRTLRQWESTGELIPSRKTKAGTRCYAVNDLLAVRDENAPTIGYARVSGHRQQDDLKRQQEMLETYGAAKGWRMEVITDLGSGLNYRKAGLQRLLELIMRRRMRRAGPDAQRPPATIRCRIGVCALRGTGHRDRYHPPGRPAYF